MNLAMPHLFCYVVILLVGPTLLSDCYVLLLRVNRGSLQFLLQTAKRENLHVSSLIALPQVSPGDNPFQALEGLGIFSGLTLSRPTIKTVIEKSGEYHIISHRDLPDVPGGDRGFSWYNLQHAFFRKFPKVKISKELLRIPSLFKNWVEALKTLGFGDIEIVNPPIISTVIRYGPFGELNILLHSSDPDHVQFNMLPVMSPKLLVKIPLEKVRPAVVVMALNKSSFYVYRGHKDIDGAHGVPFHQKKEKDPFRWTPIDPNIIKGSEWINQEILQVAQNLRIEEILEAFNLKDQLIRPGIDDTILQAIWRSSCDRIETLKEIKAAIAREIIAGTFKVSFVPSFKFEKPYGQTAIFTPLKDALEAAVSEMEQNPSARVMVVNYGNNEMPTSYSALNSHSWEGEMLRRTSLAFILDNSFGYRQDSLYPVTLNPRNPYSICAIYSENVTVIRNGQKDGFRFIYGQTTGYHIQVCTIALSNFKIHPTDKQSLLFEPVGHIKTNQILSMQDIIQYLQCLIELQFQVAISRKADVLIMGDLDAKRFGLETAIPFIQSMLGTCQSKYNGAIKKIILTRLPYHADQSPLFA